MSKAKTLTEFTTELTEIIDKIQDYVDKVVAGGELSEILMAYYRTREAYDALDAQRKRLYHIKDALDKKLVPQAFESSKQSKTTIPEINCTFYTLTKYSASILDKPKGYEWLRGNGLSEIITETVNAGTLASALKSFVEENAIDPPGDLFKFNSYLTTGMSKTNTKAD